MGTRTSTVQALCCNYCVRGQPQFLPCHLSQRVGRFREEVRLPLQVRHDLVALVHLGRRRSPLDQGKQPDEQEPVESRSELSFASSKISKLNMGPTCSHNQEPLRVLKIKYGLKSQFKLG